ncbi:MAG: release factor glutamine methyltransferase [Acidobacteriota bacterium]|nr:release factor glutamine methyltransferase [Acidobacteriota bacterium]
MPPTVAQLLAEARPLLAATSFGAPPREAALLLGWLLALSEAQVLAYGEREVPEEIAERFRSLLERRLTGEPVAYLLGEREFYGRPFAVDPRVLIPRPETEHVVEEALAIPLPERPWILDVGTGSGILPVTLALEIPGALTVGTDISPGALAVASGNARRHGVADRVRFLGADLAHGLDLSRFDLVVSNPPYIDPGDAPALSPEVVGFEPHVALFAPGFGNGGDGGDSVLARLFALLGSGVRPGIRAIVEIGFGQIEAARRHAEASGLHFAGALRDYAGIPRVVVLERR